MKTLVMTFLNEAGKKASLKLNDAKETATQEEVSTLMDTIINKNIFKSTGGDLKVKDGAVMIDKNQTKLSVK